MKSTGEQDNAKRGEWRQGGAEENAAWCLKIGGHRLARSVVPVRVSTDMSHPRGGGLRRGDFKCNSGRTSFQKGTNTRGARTEPPKNPKRRANAAKHQPAAQAERTEKQQQRAPHEMQRWRQGPLTRIQVEIIQSYGTASSDLRGVHRKNDVQQVLEERRHQAQAVRSTCLNSAGRQFQESREKKYF